MAGANVFLTVDRNGNSVTARTFPTNAGDTAAAAELTAGEAHIGEVGGRTVAAVASVTRPGDTAQYTQGDILGGSTSVVAQCVLQMTAARKNGGSGRIPRVRLTKSGTSITGASFRIHLYRTLPTPTAADNGVFSTDQAIGYIGAFDVTIDRTFTDGAKGFGVPMVGPYIAFDTASGSQLLYAVIEVRGAYQPASGEVFTLALEVDQD